MHPVAVSLAMLAASVVVPTSTAMPFTSGNILIQNRRATGLHYHISEYTLDGEFVQEFTPARAPTSSDRWHPRDLVVGNDGVMHLYNGTFDPYLSEFRPQTDEWTHRTAPGWSTFNSGTNGGLARYGNVVFASSMATASNPEGGVIAFNTASDGVTKFASHLSPRDIAMGYDGNLWALSGSRAFKFDPVTFEARGSVIISAGGADVRGIAVDADGSIYTTSWDGYISRIGSDGQLLQRVFIDRDLGDIDLDQLGNIAIGTWLSGAYLTDTSFSTPIRFEGNRVNSFVTFVVPTPGALAIFAVMGMWDLRRVVRA